MGYETDLIAPIVFSRKTYECFGQVDSDMQEAERLISYAKSKLRSLAVMTEPRKMIADEDGSGDYLTLTLLAVNDAMETLEEAVIEKYKLSLLAEHWDKCHTPTGAPIVPPEKDWHERAYLWGDFLTRDDEEE